MLQKSLAAVLTTLATLPAAWAQSDCPTPDTRPTVVIGEVDSGAPNIDANGKRPGDCTLNDLLSVDRDWRSEAHYLAHVAQVLAKVPRESLSAKHKAAIFDAARRADIGRYIDIKIIAFNDFHGNLKSPGNLAGNPAGGVDYLASYVDRLKAENPNNVVVSAGDLIGASPLVSALFHDEPTIEAMNRLGLEINAVGNHEFDEGKDELLRMQQGGCHPTDENSCKGASVGTPYPFEGAQFAFLAANVVHEDSGKTLFPAYKIKRFKGKPVAFIGMTLEGTPSIVTPTGIQGLKFLDEADTANRWVQVLKRQGVEAIVVVLHEGGLQAGGFNDCNGVSGPIVDIVSRMHEEIDLVITGHTHQAYNCKLPNRAGVAIPVISASSFGRILTEIDVKLDRRTRDITEVTAHNLVVNRADPTVAPNNELATLVANYETIAAPIANRVIGSITADITRATTPAGESALGDLIANAQLAATSAPELGGAVVAFMNPGGIRADLSYAPSGSEGAGNVTYGEAFTVQPFGNSLMTLTLTGAQIETMLEQQFTGCPNNQPFNRILQVSAGFEYAWNPAGPACDKVNPASIKINGVTVNPSASYRITVNNFIADGGDNFTVLTQGTERLGGGQDIDAWAAYFAAHSPIAPPARDRIKLAP